MSVGRTNKKFPIKKGWIGVVGGWGELYPGFLGIFGIFFNFAKPLSTYLQLNSHRVTLSGTLLNV